MTEDEKRPGGGDVPPPPSDGAPEAERAAPEPPPASPEERVTALEAEKEALRDRMLRIAADFENWKKRARKDQADAESAAREAVLRDVLEVADNLERATTALAPSADASSDAGAVVRGIGLVLRLFQAKLERYGVCAIEAKGQAFDPRVHEAISQVQTDEVAPGTVVTELQKGYRIGERLLRPAIVSVATPPVPAASEDPGTPGDDAGGSSGGGA